MSQSQYQQQNQQQSKQQARTQQRDTPQQHHCPKCGAPCDPGDMYCPECGEKIGGRQCPHCGASISATCELCSHCGQPVTDHCTFCGAEIDANDAFCPECGSPRAGILCPKCGKRSFRSFCSHCNEPLNDNAAMAVAMAQQDPKYQKAVAINKELAEMEEYLTIMKDEIEKAIADAEADDGPESPALTAEGEKLRQQYAALTALLSNQMSGMPAPQKAVEKPSVARRKQLKLKFVDADKVMAAYQAKAAQLQDALRDMLPDANMTPAQQRDYACARKMPITTTKVTVNRWWVCNFCGCYHCQPSECAEPHLGGTWINEEIKVETRVWQYLN